MTLLAVSPWIVVLSVWQRAAIIRSEDNERVLVEPRLLQRSQYSANAIVKMFNKCDVLRSVIV